MGLDIFHPVIREWFTSRFGAPTAAQRRGWPAIARGESTLILAPTGSGKTLAAFLWCLNRVLFGPAPARAERCRVLYISPMKALAVDVERNLRAPLEGIAAAAHAHHLRVTIPEIAVRTGDTPARDRRRFQRHAADILITTPESLFLLLTSNAREPLAYVDTVIVDEIHALVPGKRGAHLALSLERLEALRPRPPMQRIGLSATQRPLDEVARFLGGAVARTATPASLPPGRVAADPGGPPGAPSDAARMRPVTIVDASEPKAIDLRIEVPVQELALANRYGRPPGRPRRRSRAEAAADTAAGRQKAGSAAEARSIWASIHPRLLELVRSHRSTLLFVNSRRLAERLAAALNALAGEPLVRSHHGSLAQTARAEVEALLEAGRIQALVATSSLELGIDMGAIDLVVQIEAPPSVASGLQRIGRAGHRAGATSAGIIFPKFRGDLVACAAVARAMREGTVEATAYPRNALDVLAQQLVAMAAMEPWDVDDLFALVRRAAPYTDLGRDQFDGVLDMLSGRYPSDAFAELRPRLVWDRARRTVTAREGARRVAIANAGTIPDRGLYGVFLAGADRPVRVGELDEEMVFETRVGETFTLGASTWRVEEITHDRVLVSPAPGEPGKMPFWHGDRAGRPVELGHSIGALIRELRDMPRAAAAARLIRQHDLDATAAEILLRYLDDQAACAPVPDDRTIVIERCLDDLGDWRVCLLSPLGSRIHAPWAMAAAAQIRSRTDVHAEVMWGDEGFVVRFPGAETVPDPALLLPSPDDVHALVLRQLGGTSLFAARFRETAARSLLLPRRRPGARTPLWQQRKRAADLLAVASQFGSFPAVLETYREILRDQFDLPALTDILRQVSDRTLTVAVVDSRTPSPFAASLLFSYVANYIYDGDAPLAERRAQALSVDQAQLRELIGDAELRELIDAGALVAIERQLQHLDDPYRARSADGLHDLLLRIGDLSLDEIQARSTMPDVHAVVSSLERAHRIVALPIAGDTRLVAIEDVARYRDGLGAPVPSGVPAALLEPVRDPAGDLALRYARTHGPFTARDLAARYAMDAATARQLLERLGATGRLIEGEFRPHGTGREWIETDVLRSVRRRSLARLRHEIEPVDTEALGRFALAWHGIGAARRGPDALLDTIDQLQGTPVPFSILETQMLPARVEDYHPSMLDALMAAGEVVWMGIEPLGVRDGRIALYRAGELARLRSPAVQTLDGGDAVLEYLRANGASFFTAIHQGTGGGFPQETVRALWDRVWRGLVTNDTLHALRAYAQADDPRAGRRSRTGPSPPRRLVPAQAEGRWSLPVAPRAAAPTTEWAAATTQQLLASHGIVTRETALSDAVSGGFSTVYPVLKALEEAGRVRRGYFIAGLGGAQFALPAALDQLRSLREAGESPRTVSLAAADPANPYGAIVAWPTTEADARGPVRTPGAIVILVDGAAAAYLRRSERELLLFVPADEPRRTTRVREVARMLLHLATAREETRQGMLIATIDGAEATAHPAARLFVEEGFAASAMGLQVRRPERRRRPEPA